MMKRVFVVLFLAVGVSARASAFTTTTGSLADKQKHAVSTAADAKRHQHALVPK